MQTVIQNANTEMDLVYEALEQLWEILAFETNGTTSRLMDFFRFCAVAKTSAGLSVPYSTSTSSTEPSVNLSLAEHSVTFSPSEPPVSFLSSEPSVTLLLSETSITLSPSEPSVTLSPSEPSVTLLPSEPSVTLSSSDHLLPCRHLNHLLSCHHLSRLVSCHHLESQLLLCQYFLHHRLAYLLRQHQCPPQLPQLLILLRGLALSSNQNLNKALLQ